MTIFSPAKINLFLAVTGRRPDGYHDLVSLVAPLAWGDALTVTAADRFSLTCTDPAVPVDESNLVLRAAAEFRAATGWTGGANFHLEKRIPMGAGLGGGSSNAVAALRGLNRLAGEPLTETGLGEIAARLGADCRLFLAGAPVIMRGRGDELEPLDAATAARLKGRRVVVFKPGFGVSTVWAYRQMAATGGAYVHAAEAEARLAAWRFHPGGSLDELLSNNFEDVVYAKYLALPALHALLRERFGVRPRMSGSGSASFVLVDDGMDTRALEGFVREQWGPATLVESTFLS